MLKTPERQEYIAYRPLKQTNLSVPNQIHPRPTPKQPRANGRGSLLIGIVAVGDFRNLLRGSEPSVQKIVLEHKNITLHYITIYISYISVCVILFMPAQV